MKNDFDFPFSAEACAHFDSTHEGITFEVYYVDKVNCYLPVIGTVSTLTEARELCVTHHNVPGAIPGEEYGFDCDANGSDYLDLCDLLHFDDPPDDPGETLDITHAADRFEGVEPGEQTIRLSNATEMLALLAAFDEAGICVYVGDAREEVS